MPWVSNERGLFTYVPDHGPPVGHCTVIVDVVDGERKLCGKPFWDLRQLERHAARCAVEHLDKIREMAPSTRLPAFYGPEGGIPDVENWLEQADASGTTNRQKAIEGRKKL